MNKALSKRFAELAEELKAVEATATMKRNAVLGITYQEVDKGFFLAWRVKAKSLIANACGGEGSIYFGSFEKAEVRGQYTDDVDVLQSVKAVFTAASDDFNGGYLVSVRDLVRAEVFDSELEQAHELFAVGYITAAAVIAGTVLETTIRNLCDARGLGRGKLDKMNADLAKAGAYNSSRAKQVTSMAGIRNAAAHGKTTEYSAADVKSLLSDVERFVADMVGP